MPFFFPLVFPRAEQTFFGFLFQLAPRADFLSPFLRHFSDVTPRVFQSAQPSSPREGVEFFWRRLLRLPFLARRSVRPGLRSEVSVLCLVLGVASGVEDVERILRLS